MDGCQVVGCGRAVSKAGHQLCFDHWKAERDGRLHRCDKCQRPHEDDGALCRECAQTPSADAEGADETPRGYLSSTKIGKHFGLSPMKTNLILAELGWIEKYVKGWVPTDRGNALGANVREMKNGTPFVVWPEPILDNTALRASAAEQTGDVTRLPVSAPRVGASTAKPADSADFRSKYPATLRTQDGHMVRSRAEVLIDNWLYMQGIVHAYERRLPIEEDCLCDFYLPKGKGVYIEYWGMEADPKYRERQTTKRAIYAKHQLRLIELGDLDIERLDDVLPRLLLRFGIESV